ncbi:hypothetical protein [Aquipuribacter hungaricus]|uniref:Nucleotide exchange factor GrpE n=1 Tax=Aquipuribacter hungaricus TaxID=545624 RepID=A0ABV7WKQ9_9MICO
MSEQQDSHDPAAQAPDAPVAPVAPPVLEEDQDVPPRPEEELVDEVRTERDGG